MLHHLFIIISGAIFVFAAIAGIGPQNLNTISHGIRHNFEYKVALTCFIANSSLILFGSIGIGLSNSRIIILFINIIGIIFISLYLFQKCYGLLKKRSSLKVEGDVLTRNQAILRALALVFLNPLVFIDTIVVIDGTASQYIGLDKAAFLFGAVIGNFVWVVGLAYVASSFSHKLNRAIVWVCLDLLTIIVMAIILVKTILFVMHSLFL